MKIELVFDKIESALDAFEKWWQNRNASVVIYPVLIGFDGYFFDYMYINDVFYPLDTIWHHYVFDTVHVDNDYICYRFRVFDPISKIDRYRLTKRAEQVAKQVLISEMRQHGFYFEVDDLVACNLEIERLDVYYARTPKGVQMLATVRKQTQPWK